MPSSKFNNLFRRDSFSDNDHNSYGPSMGGLPFVFLTLVIVGSLLSLALLLLRRRRLARQNQTSSLPIYNSGARHSHHRSVSVTNLPTVGPNSSVFVYDEKMNLIANSSSPPSSAVPEIRVTFPDEGEEGKSQRGRVVVVHVTDTGSVGMSPLGQEPAPPYQRQDEERWQSLDLERMGGLREKDTNQRFS